MAYVRPVELDKSRPRGILNTTFDKEVLDSFRKSCDDKHLPMNIVLEQIMKQYNMGDFELVYRLKENKRIDAESIKIVNNKDK